MSAQEAARAGLRFEAEFLPFRTDRPLVGQMALLPWDAEIFGFRIAEFRPGDARELAALDLETEIRRWARENDVELVACRVGSDQTKLAALLATAGFRFVELQLRATLPRLDPHALRRGRLSVRAATAEDREPIARIAGSAFEYGRYHADPSFPRVLADRRYRAWMERAFSHPSAGTWIAAMGPVGAAYGFVHAEIDGDLADIRLMAVDPENAVLAGPDLLLGALRELAERGARRVTARISPANSAALNTYASLGFRFHDPQIVLHWHRPGAPHGEPVGGADAGKGEDGTRGSS